MSDPDSAGTVPAAASSRRVSLFTDAALIGAIVDSDLAAFSELHQRYWHRVQATAQAVIVDAWLAQDVTQEVFFEVWRKADRFDAAKGTVPGWISSLARSRAIDRVRASESLKRHDRSWVTGHVDRHTDTVSETVLDRLDYHRVRSTLASLSETQRQAIELCYYARHTFAEAATLLGIPLGTFKSRVRDALIKLRTEMAE